MADFSIDKRTSRCDNKLPVRKFTKAKTIFPTDDSIRKVVFLSMKEIAKKWTQTARDWGMVYSRIMVYFADRPAA